MLTRRILFGATGPVLLSPLIYSKTVASTAVTAERTGTGSAAKTQARKPVQLRFPRPTGPFPVGTTELHLIDRTRDDAYVPGRSRELMISIWYPSRGALAAPAPYLPALTAKLY